MKRANANSASMRKDEPRKPTPVELATLAALIAPKSKPAKAMAQALEFWIEAVYAIGELPEEFGGLNGTVIKFGPTERKETVLQEEFEKLCGILDSVYGRPFELDPSKPNDDARRYLASLGVNLKTPRAVIENLQQCHEEISAIMREHSFKPISWETKLARFTKHVDGKQRYNIPMIDLDSMAGRIKQRRAETKRKGWANRKRNRPEKSSV